MQSSVSTDANGSVQLIASLQDSSADGSVTPILEPYQAFTDNNILTPGLAFPDLPTQGAVFPTPEVDGIYSLTAIDNSTVSLPRVGDVADNGFITYSIGTSNGNSINLNGSSNLTLGTGSETILLYLAGDLNIAGGSMIDVTPGTKVIIYAHGAVTLAGTSNLNAISNTDTSDNVEIYVYSTEQVNLLGGTDLKAFIHAPNSMVEMSGNASFGGTAWANEWRSVGNITVNQGDTNSIDTKVGKDLLRYCLAD